MTESGETYHLGLKKGQLANRIITVGDYERANRIALNLSHITLKFTSKRGFLTITGKYESTDVSIVAIGMGVAMMDFFIREARAVIDGTIYCIRLGSCGGINCRVGQIVVADSSVFIQRNFDSFNSLVIDPSSKTDVEHYHISKPVISDPFLTESLKDNLIQNGLDVVVGLDATCDSFYSSQGRLDPRFDDRNSDVLNNLIEKYPSVKNLQMETFMLLHLAKNCKLDIKAGACAMVFADRKSNEFISHETIEILEKKASLAILKLLSSIQF